MVAAPLFVRWRARTGPRRWVFWYLALMPLVLFVGDAVPWPEDGPQNLFYSFALFVGGFLLVSEPRLETAIDDAWRWLTPVAGALIAGQLWLWISGTGERWDTGAMSVVLDLWSATVTWSSVLAARLGSDTSPSRPRSALGNEAMPIYLHQGVIIVVAWAAVTASRRRAGVHGGVRGVAAHGHGTLRDRREAHERHAVPLRHEAARARAA